MMGKLYTLLCIVGGFCVPFLVAAQPVANFSSNIVSGCPPIVVSFADQSTGNPTSWYWNLGNGTTSTQQNPSTTYLTAGTYTVSLTVANGQGTNTKTITSYITVAQAPVVTFTADSSLACAPKTIQFTNTSIPGGSGTATYLWDFGDGNTSSSQNPSHTYTTPGNYSVSLIITNSNGCTRILTKPNYIQLTQKPVVNFTSTNTASCSVPHTSVFTSTSAGGSSYLWNFGDGTTSAQQNPSHTYTTTGTYTVKLVVTNATGCKDSLVKTAYINAGTQKASFTASPTACTGSSIGFTNTTSPAATSYTWQFGNGATATTPNAAYTYTAAGTYNVKLIAQYGTCSDTAIKQITVSTKPTVQFTANATTSCVTPFTVQFNNTTSGASTYLWKFGDGGTSASQSPSYTYTANGNYTVRLIAANAAGCKDSFTRSSYIKISTPSASITASPASACIPVTTLLAANISSTVPVTNYSWNYGDGSAVTSCAGCSTATHTYTTAGTYTVKLSFTTSTGCSTTVQKVVNYGNKPTASFTASATTICPGTTVGFTNASTGAASYLWLFDNSATSSLTNPSRLYSVTDSYSVSLIAYNNGCTDTMKKTNYIKALLPKARFYTTFNCNNRKTISFHDTSAGANTYIWNFGDGATSAAAGSVSHTYAAYGTYTASLTVTNTATGCSHTYTDVVKIYPITPQFAANATIVCKGSALTFTATPDTNYYSYTWRFGNGISQSGGANTANYAYAANGTYNVTLVVTDKNGCKDSITKPAYIRVNSPVATFTGTPVGGCIPLTVNFQDASLANGGAITNRSWSFGNGNTATTATNISRQYTAAGSFTVNLAVTDINGCKDSVTRIDYISVTKPTAAFSTADTNICGNQNAGFINSSSGNSLTYKWHFGDGATSSSVSPAHAYANAGQYTVKLVVTDANGCKDSVTKNAHIKVSVAKAAFTMSDSFASCPPLVINFTNTSAGNGSYTWSFGNTGTSVLTAPATVYTYPGTYTVKLKTQAGNGCTDSATKTVTILGPTGTFSYNTTGCTPLTVSFTAISNNTAAYIWDMNNGVTQTTSTPFKTYTYNQDGKYVPKLILSDGGSCMVPVQGTDTIKADQVHADFNYSSSGPLCQSGTVQFTDTVYNSIYPVNNRYWNFGDGATGSVHNPVHTYGTPGTYMVTLVAGNTQGCKDTIVRTVIVHPKPVVNAGNNIAVCSGTSNPVTLQATGASSYTWSPSTGLSCSSCSAPSTIPTGTATYTVIGSDTNGCKDTASVTIAVRSLPLVNAGSDRSVCEGSQANLQATGGVTYTWSPATGLSCSTCTNPVAAPAGNTSYILTGTDANGCSNKDTVLVTVNAKPVVNAGPDQAICAGDPAQLQASGAVTYEWSPATGLSCTTCSSPVVSIMTTASYTVTGTTAAGCKDTDEITIVVNPLPVISVGNQAVCTGGSATMTATGASSYNWSPATGLSCDDCSSPVVSPIHTTNYIITGTDSNGCAASTQAIFTVNTLPVISAGNDAAICTGTATPLLASGAISYVWTPALGLSCSTCSGPVAAPATTTAYVVTGINANGCSGKDTVVVTVHVNPVVNAGIDKKICTGNTVQLQASGAVNYNWSPATGLSCTTCTNPVANPAVSTTYTVTGTNANGCLDTDEVTVIVNLLPAVSANNQTICLGNNVIMNASGAATYTWSPSIGLSCTTCANPVASPNATTTYMVAGIDSNGCAASAQAIVTVSALPAIDAGNDTAICTGTPTQLQAKGAAIYSWSPATGLSCTGCAAPVATPSATTKYIVTGTTAGGCSKNDTIIVKLLPKPPVTAGPNIAVCEGTEVTLHASGATKYSWSPATDLSCSTCPLPTTTPSNTTTYTVTGTDSNGCITTSIVTVTVHPNPVVDAGADLEICEKGTASLTVKGADHYTWSSADGLSCTNCDNPVANPLENTVYKVKGTDRNGCSDSDEVAINIIHKKETSAIAGDTLCKGEAAQLSATGGTSYLWLPATGLSDNKIANPVAMPLSTTSYKLQIMQGACFTDTFNVIVQVKDHPSVNAGEDIYTAPGYETRLKPIATGATRYEWYPAIDLSCTGCESPVAVAGNTTTYKITVYNEWGCKAEDDITIYTSCGQDQLFVANTFTPNGDGINDYFFPQGKGITEAKRFRVYNRWGELIFDRQHMPLNNELIGWDGTYKGQRLMPDVFVYILNAVCESGQPIEMKGDISLIH